MRKKVSVIGAGNVGATLAMLTAQSGLADVVLFDILKGMPQGKALDMASACPLWGSASSIKGTNDYKDIKASHIVVITAGMARKPGMSRDELLLKNAEVVRGASLNIARHAPDAIIIVVTNPMDAMTYAAWKASGFNHQRVFGMGGVLDSARLRAFAAWKLGVSPSEVSAMVLGGHGDEMVPLPCLTTVKGIPITEILSQSEIDVLMKRTRNAGAEIVSLLKEGSAYYAPALSVFEMIRAIILDEKKVLPCSAYLNGQYGVKGLYAGVPVILGEDGVEKIIELKLGKTEKKAFEKSINSVKTLIRGL